MEFMSTIFRGRNLLYNGYIYIKDKDLADATYWHCEKRGICNNRMTTIIISGLVKKAPSSHDVEAFIAAIEAANLKKE